MASSVSVQTKLSDYNIIICHEPFYPWFCLQGEAMWALFEAEGLSVDDDLKLILKAMKYDNILLLSSLSKDDKGKLQQFMSTKLHKIIKKENYAKYYGIFEDSPELFEFMAGQEKQLDLISKLSRKLIAASNIAGSCTSVNSNLGPANISASSSLSGKSTVIKSGFFTKPKSQSKGAADEKVKLDKNINSHIETTYEETYEVSCRVSEDGLGSYVATLDCPICESEKKNH